MLPAFVTDNLGLILIGLAAYFFGPQLWAFIQPHLPKRKAVDTSPRGQLQELVARRDAAEADLADIRAMLDQQTQAGKTP